MTPKVGVTLWASRRTRGKTKARGKRETTERRIYKKTMDQKGERKGLREMSFATHTRCGFDFGERDLHLALWLACDGEFFSL